MSNRFVVGVLAVAVVYLTWPARSARAFCGFFVAGSDAKLTNNASQVVLMRKGNRTVMTMSNNYQGPPENFAMVVPVPVVLQKENVRTLPADVFDRVDSLSAPRLVEYWEQDPCAPPMPPPMPTPAFSAVAEEGDDTRKSSRDLGVKVEAKFVTGEYEVVILSAKDSGGLETWLRQEKYNIPQGAAGALAPYIRDKSKFFVARVDIRKVKRDTQGVVQLSPLRFHFDANELRLPVRLGLLNAGGKQDLIVYVIHPDSRFEVANYANTFIPTNLEVADGVRNNFPAFFAELFDATVEKMGRRVVVTEYAWQTTNCDPCPTPPLELDDLVTLGLDVIEGIGVAGPAPSPSGSTKPSVAARERAQAAPKPFYGTPPSWVLTRLHARYSKETLSEDLIFRQAKPVMGGRANWNGTNGDEGASVSATADGGINNFQGRYIIRHYWTGPVTCKDPKFDAWGGPPGNPYGGIPAPTAAKGLATAPRGKIVLKNEVRSPVPLLGIAGKPPQRRATNTKTK
ncbi:MAG TPA: DUF2330 domain-containing protein [Polyangia bacterium]|jgi:hypothetical protein|nr:DUF2330 domain-containing protein [Polyangia bacterium]